MLLMIDNYDSFTYNIVQYFGELGQEVRVFRNDAITLAEIARLKPDFLGVLVYLLGNLRCGCALPLLYVLCIVTGKQIGRAHV